MIWLSSLYIGNQLGLPHLENAIIMDEQMLRLLRTFVTSIAILIKSGNFVQRLHCWQTFSSLDGVCMKLHTYCQNFQFKSHRLFLSPNVSFGIISINFSYFHIQNIQDLALLTSYGYWLIYLLYSFNIQNQTL